MVKNYFLMVNFTCAHHQKRRGVSRNTERLAICQPKHGHTFLCHPVTFNCCLPSPSLLPFSQKTRVIKTAPPSRLGLLRFFPCFPQEIIHSYLNPKFLLMLNVLYSFKVGITSDNHKTQIMLQNHKQLVSSFILVGNDKLKL